MQIFELNVETMDILKKSEYLFYNCKHYIGDKKIFFFKSYNAYAVRNRIEIKF